MRAWIRIVCFVIPLRLFTPCVMASEEEEIEFNLLRNYVIVVEGSIDKLSRLNFIIDTGAHPTVIHTRIARKLRLKGTIEALPLVNATIEVESVILPTLELGPFLAQNLNVLLKDLSSLEKKLGIRIDGIVGLDVLSLRNFSVDYEQRSLSSGAAAQFTTTTSMDTTQGFIAVHLEISGTRFRLLLDTGCRDLILFESRVRGRLPRLRQTGSKFTTNLVGEVELKRVRLPEVRLTDLDLGSMEAYLTEAEPDVLPGFDGLVGARTLGFKSLSVDFSTNRLHWRRDRNFRDDRER